MLEIASPSTVSRDEERKREGYQDYRVQEYWRFDPSGGHFHRQSLAGDSLRDGTYRPMAIEEIHPGLLWGRSEMLGRSICWEYGYLRWWNPASERYLETQDQTADARNAAETPDSARNRQQRATSPALPQEAISAPNSMLRHRGGRQPRPQTPRFVLPIVTWAQLGPQCQGRSESVPPRVIGQHKGSGQLCKGNVTLTAQAADSAGNQDCVWGDLCLVGNIWSPGSGVVPAVAEPGECRIPDLADV